MSAPDDASYLLVPGTGIDVSALTNYRYLTANLLSGFKFVDRGRNATYSFQPIGILNDFLNFGQQQAGFLLNNATVVQSCTLRGDGDTVKITNPTGVGGNPLFSIDPTGDSSPQPIDVYLNGSLVGSENTLNFIPGGSNVSFSTAAPIGVTELIVNFLPTSDEAVQGTFSSIEFTSTDGSMILSPPNPILPTTSNPIGIDVAVPIPIAGGGTGQTSKAAAFNALAPTSQNGDMIYWSQTGNTYSSFSVPSGNLTPLSLISVGGFGEPTWGGSFSGVLLSGVGQIVGYTGVIPSQTLYAVKIENASITGVTTVAFASSSPNPSQPSQGEANGPFHALVMPGVIYFVGAGSADSGQWLCYSIFQW